MTVSKLIRKLIYAKKSLIDKNLTIHNCTANDVIKRALNIFNFIKKNVWYTISYKNLMFSLYDMLIGITETWQSNLKEKIVT